MKGCYTRPFCAVSSLDTFSPTNRTSCSFTACVKASQNKTSVNELKTTPARRKRPRRMDLPCIACLEHKRHNTARRGSASALYRPTIAAGPRAEQHPAVAEHQARSGDRRVR